MAIRAANQATITDMTDAFTLVMSNEAHVYPGNASGATGTSAVIDITAFLGTTAQAVATTKAAIEAMPGHPAAITATVTGSGTTAMTVTLAIAAGTSAAGIVKIPVTVGTSPNQVTITKSFTYTIGLSGAAGADAVIVDVGNDAVAIPALANGNTTAGVAITVPFTAWKGTARQAVTVALSGNPAGITAGTNTAGTTGAAGSLVINFAGSHALGGTNTGELTLTFTVGAQTFVRKYSWAKALSGTEATSIDVGNEAFTINVDDLHRATGAQTINIPFTGWIGASRQAIAKAAVSVTGPGGGAMPAGIVYSNAAITDATTGAAGNIPLTVANAALVSTTGTLSGTIEVNVTLNGIAFKQILSWSKIIENPSVVLEITSNNGTVFKNTSGNTTLKANIFRNGVLLTYAAATGSAAGQWNYGVVKWYKDGVYQSAKDGETFLVDASDVSTKAVYSAQLEY